MNFWKQQLRKQLLSSLVVWFNRIHAEYQLNEPPLLPFWFTPGQFLGNIVMKKDGSHVESFHLAVPNNRSLNVGMVMQINNIVTTVNKSPTLWRYLKIKLGPKVGEIPDKNSEESKICLTLTCLVSIFVAFIFRYINIYNENTFSTFL